MQGRHSTVLPARGLICPPISRCTAETYRDRYTPSVHARGVRLPQRGRSQRALLAPSIWSSAETVQNIDTPVGVVVIRPATSRRQALWQARSSTLSWARLFTFGIISRTFSKRKSNPCAPPCSRGANRLMKNSDMVAVFAPHWYEYETNMGRTT